MEYTQLLDSLNPQQREVVSAPLCNQLVLAGAGSGKTSVLVHRIAWLILKENISPYSIMAVTFTNKAANEMRGRIESLLQLPLRNMWVGTFHNLSHRLLRAHWEAANLPENFQILDSEDQYRLVRRVLKTLELDEQQWSPRNCQWFINGKKDAGIRPDKINAHHDLHLKTLQKIYQTYEEACQRGGLVDFAELLLRCYEVLLKEPSIVQHYQQRFQYILVDEFQDTNTIQYAWLKLFANAIDPSAMNNNYIMCVGDDDQSIYGWRGAEIKNIQRFGKEFSKVVVTRLEQNYRSTKVILEAANHLIANNDNRLGKNLWTDGGDGELISLYAAFNELDEARFIVTKIEAWVNQGNSFHEVGILYRSNAQSRVLEEALISAGIPYRIYGGLRFFDRAEIKDALAYLRLILNHDDDASLERIINTPTRGIGEKTLELLREIARTENIPQWQAALRILDEKSLATRAHQALAAFIQLIEGLEISISELNLAEKAERVIQQSGLWEMYANSRTEKAQTKLENLQELIGACKQFKADESEDLPELAAFLSHAALEAGENQSDQNNSVQLMTLHSAKGLEFPLVFIAGVEEGLFPHQMSLEEPGRLEEERRLCYVGITRARQKLYLSYAEVRRLYGKETYHRPSRFISEIPDELIEEIRPKSSAKPSYSSLSQPRSIPKSSTNTNIGSSNFQLGQRVEHSHFGQGTIINYEGRGDHARVQVQFTKHGAKWLVLSYANLVAV